MTISSAPLHLSFLLFLSIGEAPGVGQETRHSIRDAGSDPNEGTRRLRCENAFCREFASSGFAGRLVLWEPSWDLCSSRRCPHGAIPRFPTLPSHPSVGPVPPFLSSVSVTQVFRIIVLNWLNYLHLYVHTALQFANAFICTFIFL